jgi:hypothetical protein
MLDGLGGSNWVAGVLSRLGGSMLGNRRVRGVGGSRSRGGNGCGTVSVLGNGGSEAGESSDGGNGVTHFG